MKACMFFFQGAAVACMHKKKVKDIKRWCKKSKYTRVENMEIVFPQTVKEERGQTKQTKRFDYGEVIHYIYIQKREDYFRQHLRSWSGIQM